jgi:thiol:disulfide interchange protein DsbD
MTRTLLITLLAVFSFTAESARAQVQDGKELVKAKLVTDTAAIEPGQKFRIGVRYEIEPRWHIYWKYSGDSGMPTKIEWQLPEGFQVGELQWPLPHRSKEPGDLEVFDYSGEVLLFAEVTAPPSLPTGPIELKAHSEWLVCETSCIPGEADLVLQIGTGTATPSESAQLFDQYAARTQKALPGDIEVDLQRAGKNLVLNVKGAPVGVALDFFPLPPAEVVLGHAKVDGSRLLLPLDSEQTQIDQLDGVLVLGTGDAAQGFTVNDLAVRKGGPALGTVSAPMDWAVLPWMLAAAMLGGLILNVMPCVLPVISLKIFGFVSEAGERPDKIFRLSLAFSSGILACFAVLAVLVVALRGAGAQIGWGFQFQDDRFIMTLAVLVFAFALNLFGVYELTVSARATGGLANLARGQGYSGAFFQGVFATVLATPCTAPYLGSAAAFAFAQPDWVTFLIFMFVGLGMALPYLVLAVIPGWTRFIPRPGPWMVHIKQFMGFLLLATLLWLLWVLGQVRGVDGVITAGGLLLVVGVIAWIKGSFWTPVSSTRSKIFAAIGTVGLLALAAGAYGFVREPSKIEWQAFSQAALDQAVQSGRPIFVDFTADWCLTCKWNERSVLETSEVRNAFDKYQVIPIKADWTRSDPEITAVLKKHGRAGVPMYLYYPGGRNAEPTVLPEQLSVQIVLNALSKGQTDAVAAR